MLCQLASKCCYPTTMVSNMCSRVHTVATYPSSTSQNASRVVLVLFVTVTMAASFVHADNEVQVLKRLRAEYSDWQPNAIVDVGANAGLWTTHAFQWVNAQTPVLMLEATESHAQELQSVKDKFTNVDYRITVLTAQDNEEIEFFQGKNTGNSIYRENTNHYKNDVPVQRRSLTVDTAVAESHLKDKRVDYLKLDVQGAELLVLQGCTKLLEQVTFVQLEVSLTEYNIGGACWNDVDTFLREHGLRFYDIGEIFRNKNAFGTGGVGQMDILYIRPTSEHLPSFLQQSPIQFCEPQQPTATVAPVTKTPRRLMTGDENLAFPLENTFVEYGTIADIQRMIMMIVVFILGYLLGASRSVAQGKKLPIFRTPRRTRSEEMKILTHQHRVDGRISDTITKK